LNKKEFNANENVEEMKNPRRSITFKVIVGYLAVAALAALAVWFTYSQVVKFSTLTQYNDVNNQQLVLVSEIATELIETENIGRRFIQSGDSTDLNRYSRQIEYVQTSLDSLRDMYIDSPMKTELDSLSTLLSKKSENLEELHELRTRDRNTSYYQEVIRQLEKVDPSFNPPNYNRRFQNLEPHQRRVLIQLLEFDQDPNQRIATVSADSLIRAVRNVLSELERENRRFREVINRKENELLVNDMVLNEQLRNLLRVIESEERSSSLARVEESEIMLKDISRTIIFVGAASILIILIFLFLIVKDISRSQRYRSQLEEAKAFTEALMQRREQFIATITHDLRSPLNTVIGYSELMEKAGLTKKQEHYLSHLKKSSEYILHLVNDLLDLSKLEAGKMLVENLPFNPKNLLEDTFYNTIPDNDRKGLKLTLDISPEADCNVLSDPFRIKQILSNLITNAYKFTDEGEITASLSMRKKIEDSYILTFSIKDSGIGISKAKQNEIFEEFSQEHGEIEKQYGGTGLGLAIAKRITTLLEGKIDLISEPGEGSEFIVRIPVKKIKGDVPEILLENVIEVKENLKGKNILIVDDESSQLALSKELIKSTGMKCQTASNGEEALEKLKKYDFHLVLTDIQMPKMDGFAFMQALRDDPGISNIPVIAISGRTNVDAAKYTEAGFAGNILKPYKPADLLFKIGQIFQVEFEDKKKTDREPTLEGSEYSLDEIFLFAGEDQMALDTILNAFIQSTRLNLNEIKKAENSGDRERIAQIAHRMLPMFKQLKINEIVPRLEQLEKKEGYFYSNGSIPLLIEEIEALLSELAKRD
jgi:signal transduction histidine kinase/FixJ family two-component response regulator